MVQWPSRRREKKKKKKSTIVAAGVRVLVARCDDRHVLWWPEKLQLPSKKKCSRQFDVFVVCGGRKSCSFHQKKKASGNLMFLLLKSDCVALY